MTQTISLLSEIIELGLKDITTNCQKKNGTMMFHDPETDSSYGLYSKSGYVRRLIKARQYPWNTVNDIYMYPLNQRPLVPTEYKTYDGQTRTYKSKQTIRVYELDKQLEIIIRAVKNYREYRKK